MQITSLKYRNLFRQKSKDASSYIPLGRGFIVINGVVIHDVFANYYGPRCFVDERLIDRRSKAVKRIRVHCKR